MPAMSRWRACWCAAARSQWWLISICRTSNPIPRKCTGSTTSIRPRSPVPRELLPRDSLPASSQATQSPPSVEAGKTQNFRRIVLVCVAEADVPAVAQHQLLAAQSDFRFVVDDHIGAVGAVIDEHELVATALDVRMHARGFAIGEH